MGNGGTTDRYTWTQQLADLNVSIPVPAGTKTKMLDVQITNMRLKVGYHVSVDIQSDSCSLTIHTSLLFCGPAGIDRWASRDRRR